MIATTVGERTIFNKGIGGPIERHGRKEGSLCKLWCGTAYIRKGKTVKEVNKNADTSDLKTSMEAQWGCGLQDERGSWKGAYFNGERMKPLLGHTDTGGTT